MKQRGGRERLTIALEICISNIGCMSDPRGRAMKERIEVDPAIHFGKPCVTGTRIPVADVLELVGQGLPFDEIIRDYYTDLKAEDIRACVRYAIEVLGVEDLHVASGQ